MRSCFFLPVTNYQQMPSPVFSVTQVVDFSAVFLFAQVLVKWKLTVRILLFSKVGSVRQTVSN